MKAEYFFVIGYLWSSCAFAQGGPPLITDDPNTPGNNKWEINIAATAETSNEERRFETPIADINYGLGDHIQLKYEVPWVITKKAEDESDKSGIDRSIAGVKWRMVDKEDAGFSLSTYPQFSFHSPGAASLHNSDLPTNHELFLPVEIEETLGHWDINQEFGYDFVQNQNSEYIYGFALTYNLKEGVALLGEIHGTSYTSFQDSDLLFNFGADIDLSKMFGLLLSAGKSVRDYGGDPHRFIAYTGVQLHF